MGIHCGYVCSAKCVLPQRGVVLQRAAAWMGVIQIVVPLLVNLVAGICFLNGFLVIPPLALAD